MRVLVAIIAGCALGFSANLAAANEGAVISRPWTKFCLKGAEPGKQQCWTSQIPTSQCDKPLGTISLDEGLGPALIRLKVTLRIRVNIQRGVRIAIDQGPPMYTGPFMHCSPDWCLASHDGDPEVVSQLRSGRVLVVEAIDSTDRPIRVAFSLGGFAAAYDQLPTQFSAEERELLLQGQWSALLLKIEQRPDNSATSCDYRTQQ